MLCSPPSCSWAPPPQASLVHTTETIRIRYFMDLLMEKSWPVMLVGNAGTGKSVLMGDKLQKLSTDEYLVQSVPFNFYTTSAMLQGEVPAGRTLHAARPCPVPPPCKHGVKEKATGPPGSTRASPRWWLQLPATPASQGSVCSGTGGAEAARQTPARLPRGP